MIPRDLARSILAEFSGRPNYPDTVEGKKAMIDAIQKACVDEVHARRVAAELQRTATFCPMPAEVYAVADAAPRKSSLRAADPMCRDCAGTGWKPIVVLGFNAVDVCECRKGAA